MQNELSNAASVAEAGMGNRFIDYVSQGWLEGNARIQAWFIEHRYQKSDDAFLRVVLELVTRFLDNLGYWNRFSYIWAAEHVKDPYLSELRKLSDKLFEVASAYAKPICDPQELAGYLLAVRGRLDSRICHWEAEAWSYVRARNEAHLAAPQETPQFELRIKMERYELSKLEARPGLKLRIEEGVERVRAKWFSSLAHGGGCSRGEIVGALSETLDVHAEAFLDSVKDEETCDVFCDSLHRIGSVLIENAFENGLWGSDVRIDAELRFESRYSHWRADALKRARENIGVKDPIAPTLVTGKAARKSSATLANCETLNRRRGFIKTYRKANDLTVAQLARRTRTSETAIQGMVRGDRKRYGPAKLEDFLKTIGVPSEQW